MPFNLRLFPLAGGYYFLVRSNFYFRYRHQRIERQKLLFNSVIAGIFLLIIAFWITSISYWLLPDLAAKIAKKSPVALPFFWTTLMSFVLGIVLSEIPNLRVKRTESIKSAIKDIGNELEQLLEASNSNGSFVCFTLSSNKVYVGWVKSLPIPNHSDYVKIWPTLSGYREKETQELIFTTQYADVYSQYVQELIESDVKTLTSLVIKMDEIVTANYFDPKMYDRFNPRPSST